MAYQPKPLPLLIINGFGVRKDYEVIEHLVKALTAQLDAAIKAADTSLQKIIDALNHVGGLMLLTERHGKIERMADAEAGQSHAWQATNLASLVYGGEWSDLAPAMRDILSVAKPAEMPRHSLLVD